jgi:hypothetical protein
MKRYAIAFSLGLLGFALANLVSLFVRSDDMDDPDSTDRYGFPFLISADIPSYSGGVSYPDPNAYFSRAALAADVAIATFASALGAGLYTAARRDGSKGPRPANPTIPLHSTPDEASVVSRTPIVRRE